MAPKGKIIQKSLSFYHILPGMQESRVFNQCRIMYIMYS
jgi:hypothetical protein